MSRYLDDDEPQIKQTRRSMKDQLRIHKTQRAYRFLLGFILILVLAAVIVMQYNSHVYEDYQVVSSTPKETAQGSKDVRLGDSFVTYSKDGAHCTNAAGDIVWNQTYEIQTLKVAQNQNAIAIASYNGREIYCMNEDGKMGEVKTTLPILNATVSPAGYVTAVLFDSDLTWIKTYNMEGKEIISGQAHMSNSGYPLAVSLSPNGTLLAVSYVYVDAGTMKTTVAFYNYGSVGDNYTDCLVSGFDYTDLIVPEVGFLSDSCAYAVADGRLMLYEGAEQPSSKAEFLFDQEVISVFSGNGHVGVVFGSEDGVHRYRMDVYDTHGKTGSFYFDHDCTDVLFEDNVFIIYNEAECLIQTYEGKIKYSGALGQSVRSIVPTNRAFRYIVVTESSIDTVQLK